MTRSRIASLTELLVVIVDSAAAVDLSIPQKKPPTNLRERKLDLQLTSGIRADSPLKGAGSTD